MPRLLDRKDPSYRPGRKIAKMRARRSSSSSAMPRVEWDFMLSREFTTPGL